MGILTNILIRHAFSYTRRPQYVDNIPKAVRGNVGTVLKQKADPARDAMPMIRLLDLEQARTDMHNDMHATYTPHDHSTYLLVYIHAISMHGNIHPSLLDTCGI